MHFKCALTYKFICVCQKHIIKHCLNPNLGSHKTGSKMQISQWPTVTMKPNETVSQHGKSIYSVKRVGIFKVIKRRQLLSKNLVTKNVCGQKHKFCDAIYPHILLPLDTIPMSRILHMLPNNLVFLIPGSFLLLRLDWMVGWINILQKKLMTPFVVMAEHSNFPDTLVHYRLAT